MNMDLTGDLKLSTQHTTQSDLAQERVEGQKRGPKSEKQAKAGDR